MVRYCFVWIKNWIPRTFWYCMGTMLNILLFNILSYNTLVIIPMSKIMTSQLTFVLAMKLICRIMSIIFSHLNLFKYQVVIFNLNIMNKIKFSLSFVGYLLTPLNRRLLTPHSMPLCQWVPFYKIITNNIFLQWMCIFMVSLLQLILYTMKKLPLMMDLHTTSYFLAKSNWFHMYMVQKQISSLSIPWRTSSVPGVQLVNR